MEPFETLVLVLAAGTASVALCHALRLSPIVGYLATGALVGPHALSILPESELARLLAELGVVFLLFTVGLELSLPALAAARREVLGLGAAQVTATAGLAGGLAWALGLSPDVALVMGGAVAMSSTAIVLKQLAEQGDLSMPQGRVGFGILLFQDLATLPFLVLIGVLAAGHAEPWPILALALAKALAVFALLLLAGRHLLRPLFRRVAAARSAELFLLAALLVALGAGLVAHAAGLSPALGAFLAGMTLGETEFRHQVEADIRPFRDLLLGVFFVTVGMRLDPAAGGAVWGQVAWMLPALILGKLALVAAIVRLARLDLATAVAAGLILAHGGEFGLLLASLAMERGLILGVPAQSLLTTLLLSMGLAPLMLRFHREVAARRGCAAGSGSGAVSHRP